DRVDDFARRCRELQAAQDVARLQSPLDGDALMQLFGRGPGAWIRPVKDYLLGLVIDGELAEDDRERATELARAFLATGGSM
ncbi:MAG: RNA nucleotidyltransferase, partial [Proteobacteria bacterium]|nr:RNA nucleotidyltransferase [Pseudomonadota bacterium]